MSIHSSSNNEILAGFIREIKSLHAQGVEFQLHLDPSQAMALIGAVQLACRHPGYVGASRQVVEKLIRELTAQFTSLDVPNTRETIRRGWDQAYDEEREGD